MSAFISGDIVGAGDSWEKTQILQTRKYNVSFQYIYYWLHLLMSTWFPKRTVSVALYKQPS